MIKAPEVVVYVLVILFSLSYSAIFYSKNKKGPSLTHVFSIMTSSAAIFKGLELMLNVIFNSALNIGQLNDSKLIIILGGFAVSWVGASSCIGRFKSIENDGK